MKKVRVIILDFDGVLAESNQVKDRAFEQFFAGFPDHEDALIAFHLAHHSHPRREKIQYLVEVALDRPGDVDLIENLLKEFSQMVSQRVIECPAVPGAIEFLQHFHEKLPLYISSVTPEEELHQILRGRGIDTYIQKAYGNPPHSKDWAIQMILDEEGVEPQEVVFVGDSLSDYTVATEMKLRFLGRDSGNSFAGVEIDLFDDLHAILREVDQMAGG